MTINEILHHDESFRYQMLSRMQSDCDYFINYGRDTKFLWAGSISKQVEYMNAIYNSFTDDKKPEWINQDDIDNYGQRMFDAYQLEWLAKDILSLMESWDGYKNDIRTYDRYAYAREVTVQNLMDDIKNDPKKLIAQINRMRKDLDKTSLFYNDCRNAIRWIKEMNA